MFSYHIGDLLENDYFTPEHVAYIENLQSFIEASALADPYRPLDFGFENDNFLNSLNQAAGGHVDYGIIEFAEIRKNSALAQLESFPIAPIPHHIKEEFDQFPGVFSIEVFIEGPSCNLAELTYSIDGVQQEGQFIPDPNDSFLFEVELPEGFEELTYNISLSSSEGISRTVYCDPRHVYNSPPSGIVINELMSSNDLTINDEVGDFEDWIEIHNPTDAAVNLGDYFLSDNSTSTTKWTFPEYALQPGEFLLVWADRDLQDGPFHTNFRLSSGGEEVLLFKEEPDGIRWVDGITFPVLPSDFSYGREADAQLPWILFSTSTPGETNSGFLGISETRTAENLIFPNPVSTLLFFGKETEYQIESIEGRVLAIGKGEFFNAESMPPGIYIVRFSDEVQRFVKK